MRDYCKDQKMIEILKVALKNIKKLKKAIDKVIFI